EGGRGACPGAFEALAYGGVEALLAYAAPDCVPIQPRTGSRNRSAADETPSSRSTGLRRVGTSAGFVTVWALGRAAIRAGARRSKPSAPRPVGFGHLPCLASATFPWAGG